jgi:hypothetical protein
MDIAVKVSSSNCLLYFAFSKALIHMVIANISYAFPG